MEMAELKRGFNNMKMALQGVHGKHCDYSCDICTNVGNVFCMEKKGTILFGLTNFWTSVLCFLDDVT